MYDAIVIGGSLAGCAAAMTLSERGWRVLILERSRFPRDKVCGEFLSPGSWLLLDRLGLSEKVKSLGGQEVDSVSFAWPRRKEITVPLPSAHPSYPYAYGLSRKGLDSLILTEAEKRGCSVRQEEEVTQTVRENGYFKVSTHDTHGKENQASTYRASVVIDAAGQRKRDGPSTQNPPCIPPFTKGGEGGFREKGGIQGGFSLPGPACPAGRRQVGEPAKSPSPSLTAHRVGGLTPVYKRGVKTLRIGFKAHFRGHMTGQVTKLFFFPGGYLGMIQVEGGMTNVCGTVHAALVKRHRGRWDSLLQEACEQNKLLGESIRGAVRVQEWLSCGGLLHGFRRGYEDGVFRVGDGACFLEPFLGQGMTMALAGGVLLGTLFARRVPKADALDEIGLIYETELEKLYVSRLRVGSFLNRFARYPFLGGLLMQICFHFPPFPAHILRKVCDPQQGMRKVLTSTVRASEVGGTAG